MNWQNVVLISNTRIALIAKAIVTITLITALAISADWSTIFSQVKYLGTSIILVTLAILILSITISTYKWQLILSIHGLNFDFNSLHKYYFVATYINNFLPTTIGGDGYRIYKTLENKRSKSSAIIAILMERVTGLAALLILAYASAIYLFATANDATAKSFLLAGTILCALAATFYFVTPSGFHSQIAKRFLKFAEIINTLSSHFDDYPAHRHLTIKVIAVSFFFHFHLCLAYVVLLNFGLNLSVSFPELFIVLAVVGILGVLPISINGIGVVEGAFIFLIGQYDVGYDNALMVTFLMRILVLPISAIGAVLSIIGRSKT